MVRLGQLLQSPRFGPRETNVHRLLTSRLAKFGIASICALSLVFGFLTYLAPTRSEPQVNNAIGNVYNAIHNATSQNQQTGKGRLHLLIPATRSNSDLCKLLLSATILNYPTPIFINYGAPEDADPYVQHLAKVEGILKYLESLQSSSEYEEDLVLILDGYDIWFQLRPDVLIKRYYELNRAANARLNATYGEATVAKHKMEQKIIFGPDKVCWPVDFSRPACWAVPDPDLPEYAFGPQTRVYGAMPKSHGRQVANMPRWLNSGTIMGPVHDMAELFRATLDRINTRYETNSDQFYFAELFGEQEFARLQHRPDLLESFKGRIYTDDLYENPDKPKYALEPTLGERTEYFIGIDYSSALFQTLAFWKPYLVWMRSADSLQVPRKQGALYLQGRPSSYSPHVFTLPQDLKDSSPPFETIAGTKDAAVNVPWDDVELNYNTITGQAPVAIHFTGEKPLRALWWPRLWFQSKAEPLRLAGREQGSLQLSADRIANMIWFKAETEDAEDVSMGGMGGAWSDGGGWFSWRQLCGRFEQDIYNVTDEDFFHPSPRPEESAEDTDSGN